MANDQGPGYVPVPAIEISSTCTTVGFTSAAGASMVIASSVYQGSPAAIDGLSRTGDEQTKNGKNSTFS